MRVVVIAAIWLAQERSTRRGSNQIISATNAASRGGRVYFVMIRRLGSNSRVCSVDPFWPCTRIAHVLESARSSRDTGMAGPG